MERPLNVSAGAARQDPHGDLATRQRVTQALFDAVLRQMAPVREQRELGIQLEVTEFEQDVCLHWNNLNTPKD